jgi:uncharacterized protein (TIGR02453 family)
MDFKLILSFLKNLSKNNDREWFEKNKPKYLEAKESFDEFVAVLLEKMIPVDDSLAGLNPKKLTFRIYRDVRFSKDKSPYKTNMGATFSGGGKLMQTPGYYLHIEAGNKSFVAGGLYVPPNDILAKVRQEIDYNPKKLHAVLNNAKFKKTFGTFDDFDKLKTAPKGYPKDHPQLELLKHKSFIVSHYFTDKEVMDSKFLKNVVDTYKILKPLNDYLNEAID